MSETRDQMIPAGDPIDIDGRRFINCTFEPAVRFRYSGGELPFFENCTITTMGWLFAGAALRTIQLLQAQNVEGHAQTLLAEMFRPGALLGE